MSDNADIVRAGIRIHPDEPADVMVDLKQRALAALDALVAERAEWERNCLGEVGLREIQGNRAEAAEAEVARLGLLLAETEGERVGWKDRAEAAEAEVKRLRAVIEAKNELLVAYRIGSHAKADRALAKLERLVGEQPGREEP
jgi:hypothetical protein